MIDTSKNASTQVISNVFVDIVAPRPKIKWSYQPKRTKDSETPHLAALLPWAMPAIGDAVRKWIALGNDPSRLAVDVEVDPSTLGNADTDALPDVHAHLGAAHDPGSFPVQIGLTTGFSQYWDTVAVALAGVVQ
jgi:hypothetical protein